jgi:two-component system response regulator NreC
MQTMTTTPTRSLRILIADDHDVVREGTRTVIERQPGWVVCGMAATGREAVALATELKPDVIVMDMTMPELNGLDAARQIKKHLPSAEVLILTGHQGDELIRKAFEAGVKGFLFKSDAHIYLIQAVEALSRHTAFLTRQASDLLFSNLVNRGRGTGDAVEPGERLSPRERQIVQLVAEGKSNREVAVALGIGVRTAETHRANILQKLELDSIAGLVRYAIRNNLIEL